MSNHYENISRYLIQKLKAEIMSSVSFTRSFSYYKLTRLPRVVLRGFDKIPNNELDREDKTEIDEIDITGNMTNGSPIITNIESTLRLSVNDSVVRTGIPTGALILSVDSSTQITIDKNVAITLVGAELTITFEKAEVYRNYELNDLEYELILAVSRKKKIFTYGRKLDQFFMKYSAITVDGMEYDLTIVAPFTDNTIPNYSDLKTISGRFQVKAAKILGDVYEKIGRVKTVDIGMESK